MRTLVRRLSAGRCLHRAIRTELEVLERRFLLSGASVQISAPTVVQGAGEFEINAVLTDSSRINSAGISSSNLAVTGPSGALKILGDRVVSSGAGTTFRVSYLVQAPGGIWDSGANGSYTIAFQPGQVFDAAGQPAAGASIQFAAAGLQPLTGPLAVAFEPSSDFLITVPGTTGKTLEVTYSDPLGINVSSINSNNLTSFVGTFDVTLASVNVLDGGTIANANYFMGAPGGAFFASSDTGYHVTLNSNDSVTNTSGQSVVPSNGIIALYEVEVNPFNSDFTFSGSNATGFVAQAIGHQSNGDIILAGLEGDTTAGDAQLVIERRFPDGGLDTTFGVNGLSITPAGNNDAAFALAIENDDSILVAGATRNHFLLSHFDANGALDTGFGPSRTGRVTTTISTLASSEVAYSVAVAPDGTIVTAGGSDGAWAFARFSSTGSPLNTFEAPLPIPSGASAAAEGEVSQIAVQSDGSIVAAGSDGGGVDVAEVDAGGTLAPGFNNGQVEQLSGLASRTDLSTGLDHSIGMALDESGRIVVANRTSATLADFAIERLNANGAPDTSFGSSGAGVITSDFSGGDDDADSVSIQPGGQIVVSGTSTDANGDVKVAVAAFNADGTVDDENLVSGQRLSATGVAPSAVAAGIVPDVAASGQGVTSVFGDASGDNVNIGSARGAGSAGATSAQSLILPGIVPTLLANPLTFSASTYSFSVIYADNSPLSADPLQSFSAITVTHVAAAAGGGVATPATATVLPVVGAVVDTSGEGSPRTVTYTVAAPSGMWGSADNGTYAVQLNGKVITDVHTNHASVASLGSFTVSIASVAGLSISGTVFNDQNDDGLQNAGEAGVAGVVVYEDVTGSGNPVGQPQAVTDASGGYTIGGLARNQTYEVREVFPIGFSQTVPASDAGQQVSLTNSSASGANFGVILGTAPPSLSGQVYNGLDGDPLSGVTVFLDANQNGVLDGGEISNLTDSSGNYRLSNLPAGNFAVVQIPPGGQTTAASSVDVTLTSGAALGPSFADVPTAVAAGPNLTGRFLNSPPASVVGGAKGQLTLQINNAGGIAAKRSIKVTLFASSTQTLAGAQKIIDIPVRLNLKPFGSTKVKLNFKYPSGLLNGKYTILASIDSGNAIPETAETDNLAASSQVTITAASVILNATLTPPSKIKSGGTATVTLNLANVGNVTATGTSLIQIFTSTDQTLDDIDSRIGVFRAHLNIKPSRNGVFRFKVKLRSGQVRAGSYFLVARIGAVGSISASTAIAQTQTSIS